MRRIGITALFVILLIAGVFSGYRYLQANPTLVGQTLADLGLAGPEAQARGLQATGIIEATRITVSNDVGGRITALYAAEGDPVEVGQPLIELDDRLVRGQMRQAEAAIAVAQAQLDLLLAGARPEEFAHAKSLVAQAEASSQAARQYWDDAVLLRDNPQELDLQIIEAETAATQAAHQAKAARSLAEAADLQHEFWGRVTAILSDGFDVPLPDGRILHVSRPAERAHANTQWNVSGQQAWEAWQTTYAAEEATKAANRALADLRAKRNDPILLDSQVNLAESAFLQAEAAVAQARAGLQALEDGPKPEQIEVARQGLAQAQAARETLDVVLEQLEARAPQKGFVSLLLVEQGEVAVPGTPLFEITDLDEVHLTVYVAEPDLGLVWLGQAVSVTVDSFPGRAFPGAVTHIADRAEFTPKNVQTREERVHTVFAVEITLSNPTHALKPGMPADARFSES